MTCFIVLNMIDFVPCIVAIWGTIFIFLKFKCYDLSKHKAFV